MRYVFVLLLTLICCSTVDAAVLVQTDRGTYVPRSGLPTVLATATDTNHDVIVPIAQSAVQSNISSATVHGWPAGNRLKFVNTGSLGNTTIFRFLGDLADQGVRRIFVGTGRIEGLNMARPDYFTANVVPGTTDMTAASNKAIAAVVTGGSVVYSPQIYSVTTASSYLPAIVLDRSAKMVGNGATIKAAAAAATGIELMQVTAQHVDISGFTLDSNNIATQTSIYAVGADYLNAHDNTFINPQSGAFSSPGPLQYAKFQRNKVLGNGYGVLFNVTGASTNVIRFIDIDHNDFIDASGAPGGDAIEINTPATPATDLNITDNKVNGNSFASVSAGNCIGLAAVKRSVVSRNIVSTCAAAGIHVEDISDGVVISDNVVSNTGRGGIEVESEVIGGSPPYNPVAQPKNITVTGNDVSMAGSAPTFNLGRGAIDIGSSTDGTGYGSPGLILASNNAHDNYVPGYYLYSVSSASITGNRAKNNVGPGFKLLTLTNSVAMGNVATDDQTPKTQTYGMDIGGGTDNTTVFLANILNGNLTAAATVSAATFPAFIANVGLTVGPINADGSKIGFYDTAPVARPTASDLPTAITALKALGLITP